MERVARLLANKKIKVSVPLRGKYCRELQAVGADYTRTYLLVSVPLRGKYCREFKLEINHA